MSIEKVKEFFRKFNLENKIQEFETSSATVELAAIALNTQKAKSGYIYANNKTQIPTFSNYLIYCNNSYYTFIDFMPAGDRILGKRKYLGTIE